MDMTLEKGKVKYVSPSQFESFDQCPRQWWANKVKKIPQPPPTPALNIGNAVHKVCELTLLARMNGKTKYAELESVMPVVSKKWNLNKEEADLVRFLARNAVVMGWFLFCPDGNSMSEMELKMEINGASVIGRADRVDKVTPSLVRIIDLKTGKRPYEESSLKKNWQSRIYGLHALKGGAEKVVSQFWFLRLGLLGYRNVEFSDNDVGWITEEISKKIDEMREFDGSWCRRHQFCKSCPVQEECRQMGSSQ